MFGCNTHLLKHIKQAILAWSFRQNIILGCYPVFVAISARDEFIVKALVGAFSAIVKTGFGTDGSFYSTRQRSQRLDTGAETVMWCWCVMASSHRTSRYLRISKAVVDKAAYNA